MDRLFYNSPTNDWNCALPLGNGTIQEWAEPFPAGSFLTARTEGSYLWLPAKPWTADLQTVAVKRAGPGRGLSICRQGLATATNVTKILLPS